MKYYYLRSGTIMIQINNHTNSSHPRHIEEELTEDIDYEILPPTKPLQPNLPTITDIP